MLLLNQRQYRSDGFVSLRWAGLDCRQEPSYMKRGAESQDATRGSVRRCLEIGTSLACFEFRILIATRVQVC